MKACVCAAQRDVNRALIAENSVATRRVKNNSERARLTAANAAADTAESNQLTVNNSQMLNVPCSAASCSPLSHHEEQQQHHQPAVSSPEKAVAVIINHVNEVESDVIKDCQADCQSAAVSINHGL